MRLHPTALLPGLLVALLVSSFQDAAASANQPLPVLKQSAPAVQQADGSTHTFHRGSGRRQLLMEFTVEGLNTVLNCSRF